MRVLADGQMLEPVSSFVKPMRAFGAWMIAWLGTESTHQRSCRAGPMPFPSSLTVISTQPQGDEGGPV